jgi:hypothetical protein
VAVSILNDTLGTLLPPRSYSGLRLLGQANLVLLWVLRFGLSWCCWGWRWVAGGILRYEPWYRESDQKKNRIHMASKTLALMHEPESLHCLPPFGEENSFLLSWLVLEHFSACYILLSDEQCSFSCPTGLRKPLLLCRKSKGEMK